jgi:hypothetical protein
VCVRESELFAASHAGAGAVAAKHSEKDASVIDEILGDCAKSAGSPPCSAAAVDTAEELMTEGYTDPEELFGPDGLCIKAGLCILDCDPVSRANKHGNSRDRRMWNVLWALKRAVERLPVTADPMTEDRRRDCVLERKCCRICLLTGEGQNDRACCLAGKH